MSNSPSFLSGLTEDSSFTYAVSLDGSLYKYSSSIAGFELFYTPTTPLPNSTHINLYSNRLVLNHTTASSAEVYVYQVGNSATPIFNYTDITFAAPPVIAVSPQLTKVIILGNGGSNGSYSQMSYAFHIDWAAQTVSTITIPQEALVFGFDYFLATGDEFLYVRQIRYSQTYSWIPTVLNSLSLQEHVYFFAQNTIPVIVFTKNISIINNTDWKHADVVANTTGSYLYTEMDLNQGNETFKIVNVSALSRQQAIFNNDYNDTFTSETIDGEVQVCPPGCIDCECTGCKSGFAYDTLTQTCTKCGPGCSTCGSTDPSKCNSCTTGLFFDVNASACLDCDPTCLSCGTTATTCEVCYPGWSFNANQQCNECPLNCFNCSSSTVCTMCDKGYGLTANGTCRKCMTYCSECNPNNITECTSCAKGLELRNGRCYSCPLNCLECSSTACVSCVGGYTLNSYSVCVLQCELPCVTCLDN